MTVARRVLIESSQPGTPARSPASLTTHPSGSRLRAVGLYPHQYRADRGNGMARSLILIVAVLCLPLSRAVRAGDTDSLPADAVDVTENVLAAVLCRVEQRTAWGNPPWDLDSATALADAATPSVVIQDILSSGCVLSKSAALNGGSWLADKRSGNMIGLAVDLTSHTTNEYGGAWLVISRVTREKYHAGMTWHVNLATNSLVVPLVLGVTNSLCREVFLEPREWPTATEYIHSYLIAREEVIGGAKVYALPRPEDPSEMRNKKEYVNDPISVVDGDVKKEETDIVLPCPGLSLVLKRRYGSRSGRDTTLGHKWMHTYDALLSDKSLNVSGTDYSWKILQTGTGEKIAFPKVSEGVYDRPRGRQLTLEDGTGFYRLTEPGGIVWIFDTNGIPETISDPVGNSIALTYAGDYPTQKLTRAKHSNGQYLDFSYTNGLLFKVTTHTNNISVEYAFNTNRELTNVTRHLPSGDQVYTYRYDACGKHMLTQRVNAAGHVFAWLYEANGVGAPTSRGVRSYVADTNFDGTLDHPHPPARIGAGYSFSFDFNNVGVEGQTLAGGFLVDTGNLVNAAGASHTCWGVVTTTRNDRAGTTISYKYHVDPHYRRVTHIEGPNPGTNWLEEGRGTVFRYDGDGNQTEERVYDNALHSFLTRACRYDDTHNVTNLGVGLCTAPTEWWAFAWNTNDNLQTLASVVDPQGARTEFEYADGLLMTAKVCYATNAAHVTSFGYLTNGLLSGVTNANGNWVRYGYDPYGFPTSRTPRLGPGVDYRYSRLGHLERMTLPGVTGPRVTRFFSDPLGRVTNVVYPDGLEETFLYNAAGDLTNHADRAGRTTSCDFAPTHKLRSVTRTLAGVANQAATISFAYDNQFNTLSITDALGRAVETYVLDLHDRPVAVTNLEGQAMITTYGVADFVDELQRFDGTTVDLRYDTDANLCAAVYPGGTNTFTYLKNGLLRTAVSAAGTVSNAYNMANRAVATTGIAPGSTVSYAYYPGGQVSNMMAVAGQTRYAYDAAERPSGIESGEGGFVYTYHPHNGLVATCTCTNIGLTATYGYDILDRVTNITWSTTGGVVRSFGYTHSNAGMIARVAREDGTAMVYTYDTLDRLTGEECFDAAGKKVSSVTYKYDLSGNRLTCTRDGTITTYDYPGGADGNRLAGWSTVERAPAPEPPTLFVFGAAPVPPPLSAPPAAAPPLPPGAEPAPGTGGTNFHDAAGCVTSIVNSGVAMALTWDGQYRLTAASSAGQTLESYGYDALGRRTWLAEGGTTNFLVYSGPHVVAEVDAAGTLLRSYTYGPGIDNILAMTVHTNATTNTYYFLKDHLGTVHTVVDASGTTVESYTYDAWGNVTAHDAAGHPIPATRIGNRYLFQGREYSWQTGLYYFRARWYNPNTARWLSKDPIGISGGLNQYVAFGNNPVNFVDPSGLCDEPVAFWSGGRWRYFNGYVDPNGWNNMETAYDVALFSAAGGGVGGNPVLGRRGAENLYLTAQGGLYTGVAALGTLGGITAAGSIGPAALMALQGGAVKAAGAGTAVLAAGQGAFYRLMTWQPFHAAVNQSVNMTQHVGSYVQSSHVTTVIQTPSVADMCAVVGPPTARFAQGFLTTSPPNGPAETLGLGTDFIVDALLGE